MTGSASPGLVATGIPLRHLGLVWRDVEPLLAPAVGRTPDKPDVLARLLARDAQLWAVYDGARPVAAIVTQITLGRPMGVLNEAKGLVAGCDRDEILRCAQDDKKWHCRIWLVGGARVRDWIGDFLPKLEDWARALGCEALWGSGREGWTRIVTQLGGSTIGSMDGFPAWQRRL